MKFGQLPHKDIIHSFEFTDKTRQQANFVVNYVRSIKYYVNKLMREVHHDNHNLEQYRLPEHVISSFKFAPLFDPIVTFGVDFSFNADDQDCMKYLHLYLLLKDMFEKLRFEEYFGDAINVVRPLFIGTDEQVVDTVIAQMEKYLYVFEKQYANAYVNAVGFYYGIDYTSARDAFVELTPNYPYIILSSKYKTTGEIFAHYLAIAMESYYSPKINNFGFAQEPQN